MSGMVAWNRGYYPATPSMGLTPYSPPAPTPPTQLTSMRDWWRELRGDVVEAPGPVQSTVMCLRQNLEGAAVGALLALIETELGGLDLGGKIPLDLVGAAIFNALSIKDSGKPDGLSVDFRAIGQSCTTIASFRMVQKWREAAHGMPRNMPQTSGDPVIAAGKSARF